MLKSFPGRILGGFAGCLALLVLASSQVLAEPTEAANIPSTDNDVTITGAVILGTSSPVFGFITQNNSDHDILAWPYVPVIIRTPSGKIISESQFVQADEAGFPLKPSKAYVQKCSPAGLVELCHLKDPGVYHVFMFYGNTKSNEIAFLLEGNASPQAELPHNANNSGPALEIAITGNAPLEAALIADHTQILSTSVSLDTTELVVSSKNTRFATTIQRTKSAATLVDSDHLLFQKVGVKSLFSALQANTRGLYSLRWKVGSQMSEPVYFLREK